MKALAILGLAAVVSAVGSPALGDDWSGDIDLLLAGKHLSAQDWGPTDRQGELGLMSNWQDRAWPVALAFDLLAARRDADFQEGGFNWQHAQTTEMDVGARKIWRPGDIVRPYAGGGLTLASAELERTGPAGSASDSSGGVGLWLGGGVAWTLGQAFNIGVDAKFSRAEVDLLGAQRNAGGFHLGLLLGYHWGG